MDVQSINETPTIPLVTPKTALRNGRRALRRDMRLSCEVFTRRGAAISHNVSDLSPYGLWIDTPFPLHPGRQLTLSFRPPRWGKKLTVSARVTRIIGERWGRPGSGTPGMAVEFFDLSDSQRDGISRGLKVIPPRLTRRANSATLGG